MFLVRIMTGRKPRAYRLDGNTIIDAPADTANRQIPTHPLKPHAWWIKPPRCGVIGIAAIGHTIDEAHKLIARLRTPEDNAAVALREVGER